MHEDIKDFDYAEDLSDQRDQKIKKEKVKFNIKNYSSTQFLFVIQMILCGIVICAILLLKLLPGNSFSNLSEWYYDKLNDSLLVCDSIDACREVFGNVFKTYEDKGIHIKDYHNHITTKGLSSVPVSLTMPLSSPLSSDGIITSQFGSRKDPTTGEQKLHKGIDIAADECVEIYPVISGVVDSVNEDPSYGKYVIIDHGNDIKSLYAHCSDVIVHAGENVDIYTPIAHVGSTGDSTGNHLHLELLVADENIDPEPLISDVSI